MTAVQLHVLTHFSYSDVSAAALQPQQRIFKNELIQTVYQPGGEEYKIKTSLSKPLEYNSVAKRR